MKESTKKILAFSLVLVVLGGVLGTIGFALGGINHNVWVDSKGFHRMTKDARVSAATETFSDTVEEIDLASKGGAVEIVEGGTETKVVLQNPETSACVLEDGVLTITSNPKPREGFSIGFDSIDEGHHAYTSKNKVTVYLPAGTDLSAVTLKCAVGNIKLTGILAGQLDVSAGLGDVDINDSTIKGHAKIDSSAGDVRVAGTFQGEVVMDNDLGDVRFESTNGISAHNYKLETSMGAVHFPGISDESDSLSIDNGAKSDVTVSTSSGDITVQ